MVQDRSEVGSAWGSRTAAGPRAPLAARPRRLRTRSRPIRLAGAKGFERVPEAPTLILELHERPQLLLDLSKPVLDELLDL
jgi:hypothetical protein